MAENEKSWMPHLRSIPADEVIRHAIQHYLLPLIFGGGGLLTFLASKFGDVPKFSSVEWVAVFLLFSLGIALVWGCYEYIGLVRVRKKNAKAPNPKVVSGISSAEATETAQSFPMQRHVYVGNIIPRLDELFESKRLSVTFFCFNGNSSPLYIGDIRGFSEVSARSFKHIKLPPPSLMSNFGRDFLPCSELYIEIEQKIPDEILHQVKQVIEGNETVFLRFVNLNVMLIDDKRNEIRLPVWSGVSISRKEQALVFGRVIEANSNVQL